MGCDVSGYPVPVNADGTASLEPVRPVPKPSALRVALRAALRAGSPSTHATYSFCEAVVSALHFNQLDSSRNGAKGTHSLLLASRLLQKGLSRGNWLLVRALKLVRVPSTKLYAWF